MPGSIFYNTVSSEEYTTRITCQLSMIGFFRENSKQLLAVNFFWKKAPPMFESVLNTNMTTAQITLVF